VNARRQAVIVVLAVLAAQSATATQSPFESQSAVTPPQSQIDPFLVGCSSWAFNRTIRVLAVPSPLQCPALDYRSAFSRAVEVQVPGRRHLYISGTASIDEHGASVYRGDIDGQIRWTMAVVEAMLKSRNMTWNDNALRAVTYFKDLQVAPRFTAYCRSHGLSERMVTPVQATMCREELLFEIELDAAA